MFFLCKITGTKIAGAYSKKRAKNDKLRSGIIKSENLLAEARSRKQLNLNKTENDDQLIVIFKKKKVS